MIRAALAALLAAALTGCAGYHSLPLGNFADADSDGIVRIAFDQDGDPYPSGTAADPLALPEARAPRNVRFSIARHYADIGKRYDRAALLDDMARRIADSAGGRRVVFVIKGFNNSYRQNNDEYYSVRDRIAFLGPEPVALVQVYWDAIHKGKFTAPLPLAYFADSLTYSNRAGECGLREVLRRLPAGTDVTFLTHSRGAAVALSAVAAPDYDDHIGRICAGANPLPPPQNLGDVRLVSFAPAIGDGHLRDNHAAQRDLFAVLDKAYFGVNPNDPAVTKHYGPIDIPDNFAGDTRMGGDRGYVAEIERLYAVAAPGRLAALGFDRPSHDWLQYLALPDESACMLWAGRIVRTAPQGCLLQR